MYGYIPVSLIMAGTDPYGPTGEFAGGKPSLLDRFRQLSQLRTRRAAPKAAKPVRPCILLLHRVQLPGSLIASIS